jgi:hypothetical protein
MAADPEVALQIALIIIDQESLRKAFLPGNLKHLVIGGG